MLAENYKIVPIFQDGNLTTTITGDSIDMREYHSATYIFTFGTLTTAASVLTINSGATNAAISSPLYFNYAFGGAAIGTATAGSATSCDVLAAWTNANTLSITNGTYDNFMLVVELEATVMDIANGEYFLTPRFTDPGTAEGTVDCIAILQPRYKENRIATCLA